MGAAVLQSFASSVVLEQKKVDGFHPQVYGAMMAQVQHWQEHLGKFGPDGPLEDENTTHNVLEFREWAIKSSEAANEHARLTSHYWAEVAQHVLSRERGKEFMKVAAEMFSEDPSLDEGSKYAVDVF